MNDLSLGWPQNDLKMIQTNVKQWQAIEHWNLSCWNWLKIWMVTKGQTWWHRKCSDHKMIIISESFHGRFNVISRSFLGSIQNWLKISTRKLLIGLKWFGRARNPCFWETQMMIEYLYKMFSQIKKVNRIRAYPIEIAYHQSNPHEFMCRVGNTLVIHLQLSQVSPENQETSLSDLILLESFREWKATAMLFSFMFFQILEKFCALRKILIYIKIHLWRHQSWNSFFLWMVNLKFNFLCYPTCISVSDFN